VGSETHFEFLESIFVVFFVFFNPCLAAVVLLYVEPFWEGLRDADSKFVDLGDHSLAARTPIDTAGSLQQQPPALAASHPAVKLGADDTTAVFKNCAFRHVHADRSAVIVHHNGLAGVQVHGCTFEDNVVGRNFATWSNGTFFSDGDDEVLQLPAGDASYPATKRAYSLEDLSSHEYFSFLSTKDGEQTFIRLVQVLPGSLPLFYSAAQLCCLDVCILPGVFQACFEVARTSKKHRS
jgi:hypothetical protein